MPVTDCQEGMLLIANAAEALRRQSELPAQPTTTAQLALEMVTLEAVKSATRHVTDHMMQCPVCRND